MSLWLLYKFLECTLPILLVKLRVLFLRFSETNIFRAGAGTDILFLDSEILIRMPFPNRSEPR